MIDAIREVERNTDLGEGYHRFTYKDAELLEKPRETELLDRFETNIEVWDDARFNRLLEELPAQEDPNAIWVYNRANKKQFWLIFRASCFESNNQSCTNTVDGTYTPDKGAYALVARTIARFVGSVVKTCDQGDSDPMCADFPNDLQWSESERTRIFRIIDNGLELIRNDPNFYEVFNP